MSEENKNLSNNNKPKEKPKNKLDNPPEKPKKAKILKVQYSEKLPQKSKKNKEE